MKKLLFIMFLLMIGCSSVDVSKPNNNINAPSSTTNTTSGINSSSTTNKASDSTDNNSTSTSNDNISDVNSSSIKVETSTSSNNSVNDSASVQHSSTSTNTPSSTISSSSNSTSTAVSSSSSSSSSTSSVVSSSSSSSSSASSVVSSSSSSSSSKEEVITITEIIVSSNYQKNYTVGDKLNIEGLQLIVTYSNSTSETIDVTNDMLSNNFDMSIAGEKVITITYEGLTTTFTIVVKEPPIVKVNPEINFSVENNATLVIEEDTMPEVTVSNDLPYIVEYKTENNVSLGETCPTIAGTYTLTVTVDGNKYYNSVSKSITFNLIEKTTPEIQVSIQDNAELVVGKVTPVISVSDDLPYTVKYFKDGNLIGNTFPIEEGTYTLTVTVEGDKYHHSNTTTITFTLINEYNISINNVDGAIFIENQNSTAAETKIEYMATVTLNEGDVITIKDANGNLINDLYWENTKTSGNYTVTIDGEHTLYLKFRTDGSVTVWVNAPLPPVDPSTQPIRVYFSNSENWTTVNAYIWDNNGTHVNGAWPGTVMNLDSESGLYYVDNVMPGYNIIFNNGSSQTADLKVPTDGNNLCAITNGECKWTKLTLENYLYINNVKSELFSINANCTTPNVAIEFYLTITLAEGDVITIKDANGNSVGILYWQNTDSTNDYVAPCDGEFTIYYKIYDDGGRSIWVGEPTVLK